MLGKTDAQTDTLSVRPSVPAADGHGLPLFNAGFNVWSLTSTFLVVLGDYFHRSLRSTIRCNLMARNPPIIT